VLDILVTEIVLQRAGIVAIIGQPEAAGVTQHVWVHSERQFCCLAEALDEMMETHRADRPAALANEYVGFCRVFSP
jgi:hypothetical protein